MKRPRHPKKEVEDAIQYAESKGWTLRKMSHWGRLFCVHADRDGCQIGVNGTPRDADAHARQIKRAVDRCPHEGKEAEDENYEFSIIASGLDPEAEDFESRFYDAGCDDATISFQRGHIIVDFARKAESIGAAIASAIDAVASAGAKVDRVEPDPFVSLSEIAARTGMTRAAMTQYSKGQRSSGFPPPVAKVTSDSPLWDWAITSRWLFDHGKLTSEAVIMAEVVKAANEAIEHGEAHIGAILRDRAKECEAAL